MGNFVKRISILFLLFYLLFLVIPIITATAFEIDETTTCIRIFDGDSFVTAFGEIRLADIDCPDSGDPGYTQAANALASLILGTPIYLDIDDVSRTDKYGRYVCMCYVKVSATQYLNINKYLVDNGYAVVWNHDNEFNPSLWQLYYPVDANSATNGDGANGHDGFNVGTTLPVILLACVVVAGIIMYTRQSASS